MSGRVVRGGPPGPDWVALVLDSEIGQDLHACGSDYAVLALAARYTEHGIAEAEILDCCKAHPGRPCLWDRFDTVDHCRRSRLYSEGLARAEGRKPRPFTGATEPCRVHGTDCLAETAPARTWRTSHPGP